MSAITLLKNVLTGRKSVTPRKPRARTRLNVESLEDRVTPSILFASYGNGTFDYNTNTHAWQQITSAQARQITEGADGVMYGSYGDGTYRYNYWSNSWSKLTSAVASTLDASDDNTLYASFGNGTFRYTNSWQQLTTATASKLAAVDANTFFGSYGNGTYRYANGQFSQLTSVTPQVMAASSDGTLVATYGNGTFTWHSGWTQISTRQALAVTSEYTPQGLYLVDPTFLMASFADGTYNYNVASHSWSKVNSSATSMLAREPGSGQVVASDATGTYVVGGPQLTGAMASQIAS